MGADGDVSVVNDDENKANVFWNYFSGVFTQESEEEFNELPYRRYTVACEEVSFSDEVILDKLKKLKVNKSPGPDSVPGFENIVIF